MSSDGKLRIKISDLKEQFSTFDVLNEAFSFGELNKSWKFWMCYRCNEKFTNAGSFMHHVVREHVGSLLPEMESVLPQNVENEWAEMILNCSWKPLELNAAVRILEKQSKSLASDLLDDSKECFAGQEKSGGRNCSKESLLHKNWPLSDDPERAQLLARIRASFEALIKHKYLAASHLSKVIHIAVEELQVLACGSQLLNSNVDQTHLCICFLGATGLQKILNFGQGISQFCGLCTYSDQSNIATDDSNTGVQGVDITENIILSQDASYLIIDWAIYGSTAGTSEILEFTGPSEQLTSWIRAMEENAQQGLGILQALENESHHVQGMCESKCEHLSYEEALRAIENFCLEKGKKREHATDSVVLCYETLLRNRQEELIKSDSEINIIRNRFELDAIRNVLLDFQETYNN